MALTIEQIIGSITGKLIARFPNIEVLEDDIKEGFSRPSFFVDIDNNSRNAGLYTAERNMTIRIYYFPKDRYKYSLELLQMQDDLEQLFNFTIQIENRIITLDETTSDVVDGVLQFEFDLNYRDATNNSNDENNELMQELVYREVDE